MSQTHCPRCHEPIRLPEPLPAADASGQCPWCQETFTLHELLDQLPPMLQIVDAGTVTVETEEDDDSSFMLHDEEPARPAAVSSSAPLATPAFSASPRRQKKSSPVKTIFQIVGGGLVSIPLALGILLLLKYFGVANPNIGFWPLDGTSFNQPVTATQPRAITEDERSPEPEQGGRLLDDEMPDFGEFDPESEFDRMLDGDDDQAGDDPFPTFGVSETDESDQGDPTDTPEPERPTEMADPQDADFPELTDDSAMEEPENLLSISPTEVASPLTDSREESTASAEPLDSDAERLDSDVEAVVAAAKQASTALAEHSDPATRSGPLKDLYLELAKLGELASPDQSSLYAELFTQLRRENQLETMGRFGKPWFSAPSRLYEGIFATGTFEQQGDGYELRWDDGESVPVDGWEAYPDDPTPFVGKKVALLANIDTVAESRRFLIGYLERLDRDSEDAEQP